MMNRLVALLTLLVALSTRAESPADQLGWQLTMHARTLKKMNLFESMDKSADMGLKYFSLSANVPLKGTTEAACVKLTDAEIKSIRDHAKAKGLTLVNAYLPLPSEEKECRKSFEFARKVGVPIIVGEPKLDGLDMVEKLCKEYNIKVAIHDHPKPSHYWNPETVLEAIKGRSPLMGACADTGHFMRSGLDPVKCLKQLEGHIFCLHFKDVNERKRSGVDVPYGNGVGNVKGQMEELKRQNFTGAFCIEYESNMDNNIADVEQCVKFFNKTCAELQKQ